MSAVQQDSGLGWIPLSTVEAWNRNPRRNDEAVEPVAQSIVRFGFTAPAVVWKSRQRLVAGHTRLRAIHYLREHRPVLDESGHFTGWEPRPADDPYHVVAGYLPDGSPVLAPSPDAVPVRMQEFRSEAEADAYALADNKLGELADWDDETLAAIIRDLDAENAQITGLGWDDADLELMLDDFNFDPAPDGEGQGELDKVKPYYCPSCGAGHTIDELRKATEQRKED